LSNWVFVAADGSKPDIGSLVRSPFLAFDVESNGKDMGLSTPIGFSLACSAESGYYAPVEDQFAKGLLAVDKLYIAHNASFDRSMMKKCGVIINRIADTMVAAHLLEEPILNLKHLSPFQVTAFSDLPRGFAGMDLVGLGKYSCPHAMAAYSLWWRYEKRMRELGLTGVFWNVEMPLVPVISDMELNGVAVSRKALESLGETFDGMLSSLEEALQHWSGTKANFNSPEQLSNVLFNKLQLPPHKWRRTSSGRPSVDADYLESIKHLHPFVPLYLQYKKLMTLRNSYVRSLIKDIHPNGRVYCKFNQTGTRTGRLSSSEPNLQKIPTRAELGRKIREAFVAPEGYKLMSADMDQLELRMLAICSKNPFLLDAFRNNRDIHRETAIRVFGDEKRRHEGKTMNFQLVYGGGTPEHREMFFGAYSGVKEWQDSVCRQAREAQYIRTLNGRIRTIPEYTRGLVSGKEEAHGDREVISTLIQGSSAEEVKVGMRKLWEKVRDTSVKMLLQVHDEVLLEVPKELVNDVAEVAKESMTITKYEIPLTVTIKVGDNWGTMTRLEV